MKTMILMTAALGALMISGQAMAISEQNYAQDMASEVMPFYATGVTGTFNGVDNIPLSYIKFENPNEIGAIVIVNGRTETYDFYAEPIYDLAQAGYSIYTYDHRGQGHSGRLIPDSEPSYVKNFDDYVTDMKTFVDTIVNAKAHKKLYVFSHSMGGAISALYGLKYPTDFNAYVLSSPMFGIPTQPYSTFEAHAIVDWNILIGQGASYAKGQTPYDPTETFANNILTTSEPRWDTRHAILIANPSLQMGGASNKWVSEALSATSTIQSKASSFTPKAIVFQAGQDKVVVPAAETQFCSAAPSCSLAGSYPNGYHELIREQDYIRSDLYAKALQFFSEN